MVNLMVADSARKQGTRTVVIFSTSHVNSTGTPYMLIVVGRRKRVPRASNLICISDCTFAYSKSQLAVQLVNCSPRHAMTHQDDWVHLLEALELWKLAITEPGLCLSYIEPEITTCLTH